MSLSDSAGSTSNTESTTPASIPPAHAAVLIIGGGIVGCSIAFHLIELGIRDVVLLERRQLTCGTTWHAAGLVPQLRATRNLTDLAVYTSQLFETLEARTGQATGFRRNGSVALALNDERWEELRRSASVARSFGVEAHLLSPSEVGAYHPLADLTGVLGGLWTPNDGQTNPVDTTLALARGARSGGARIFEGYEVSRILHENGRACGVDWVHAGRDGEHLRSARQDGDNPSVATRGQTRADVVVLAGGMWSAELARPLGIRLPLQAAEHFYVVTEYMPQVPRNLPTLRVPDEWAYYKEDAGKLLLGAFEPVAKPWAVRGIPRDFCFDALPDDVAHFEPVLEKALARVPALAGTGIATWFNGPESFTPDDRYLLGETAEVRDLFVACGFNSIGIQSSGGAGRLLAQWIRDRQVPMDMPGIEVRRMHPVQGTRAYLSDRTTESLGLLYAMHWPFRQPLTARNARRSPFHERLLAAGACMGELAGWERPSWFDPSAAVPGAEPPVEIHSYRNPHWLGQTERECLAVRDAVALFDQSSMAKFRVLGRDACAVLDRVSTALIDRPTGRVIYTQWLNPKGGIEADLTITRLAQDDFLVVTSAGAQVRDAAFLREAVRPEEHCSVIDLTSGLPMLGLMGPASRALLGRLCPDEDFSNEGFPFATSREIEIGYAIVRASRITYVGELGWELYIPAESALQVYERIVEAGRDFGLTHAGTRAMNACRTEKGYRHWGHDIGVEDTPLQAGLGFTCAWDKPGGFVGRDALMRAREASLHSGVPERRLVQIRLADPKALLIHDEPIFSRGARVGIVSSGMYGHRLNASLGMGWVQCAEGVSREWLAQESFEIEVASERIAAQLQLQAWYDPGNARIRG
ncbi:MAG: GcvT family protein [Burkholderiaceae bacterium]